MTKKAMVMFKEEPNWSSTKIQLKYLALSFDGATGTAWDYWRDICMTDPENRTYDSDSVPLCNGQNGGASRSRMKECLKKCENDSEWEEKSYLGMFPLELFT